MLPPARASRREIAAAVEWLRDYFARNPAASAVPRSDGDTVGCRDAVLCSPVTPLGFTESEVSIFGSVKPVQSGLPTRRKNRPSVDLQGPRPGPPDLHAAVLTFPARLLMYVNKKWDGDAPGVYKRSYVARNVYSRLVSRNTAKVNKLTVMKFALGLQLERRDADLLMQSAGFAFSNSIPWDMAVAYCIDHQIWNIDDLNEILMSNGYEPFPVQ